MHINISTLLDVAIGLIFIFFVFSIFVSGIVELVNTLLEQRAKLLRIALDKLLGPLANDFFNHQLTKVKQERFWGFLKPINYLSADSFSTVLIDLLVKAGGPVPGKLVSTQKTLKAIQLAIQQPNHQLIRELIEPILSKADDFQTFKYELEKWYNGYMEQVSGWFKRYAQGVVWIVAAVVTLLLNVDTIYLTNRLFNDNGLRERLVEKAVNTTQNGGKSFSKDTKFGEYLHKYDFTLVQADSSNPKAFVIKSDLTAADSIIVQSTYIRFVQDQVADLKLPIGWDFTSGKSPLQPGQSVWLALLGWVLTAAALSFGAPFWFDLLLKLVNIRNTARRPPGNPDPAN
ncbi:hypothetical protein [Spirosoma flavum]|uniref:Uncharacterized protein n=1 Tax=Spirosoma flavum TaxID=2048557 RepID=A0ABW6AQD1_9BACT